MTFKIKTKGCNFSNTKYCKCLGCYYECAGQLQHIEYNPCCCWTGKKELKYYFYRYYVTKEYMKIYPVKTKKQYLRTIRKMYMDKIRKYRRTIYIE